MEAILFLRAVRSRARVWCRHRLGSHRTKAFWQMEAQTTEGVLLTRCDREAVGSAYSPHLAVWASRGADEIRDAKIVREQIPTLSRFREPGIPL